jgi:uncharacterized phage infection (PIP) family protein YhgE
MIKENKKTDPQEKDLIDQIADALPPEVQALYYREMRHLRSLPENDEMLRILRAIMFLTLLTEQVPARVLTEREKLERACTEIIGTAKRLEATGSEYYQELRQRLIQLPGDIATGISPKAIVELITGDLKKQFSLTTIPTVAKELAANADNIKTATKEYTRASVELNGSWRSTADSAHEAINKIKTSVSEAAKASQKAAVDFSNIFKETYRKALWVLIAMGLATEIIICLAVLDFLPRAKTVYEIPPEVQSCIEQKKELEMKFARPEE